MALKIQAKGKTAEIWLYDAIGGWDGISSIEFIKELKDVGDVNSINVHINSPGGEVFEGIAIYNALKQHKAHVSIEIDGYAASIASVIAMAGDSIYAAKNSFFMIHNPWGCAFGESNELRKTADLLDQIRDSLVKTYLTKAGHKSSEKEISDWMNNETWFTAEEAIEAGFINEITNELALAASFDLSKFKNCPQNTIIKSVKDIEVSMRSRIAKMQMWSAKNKPSSALQA